MDDFRLILAVVTFALLFRQQQLPPSIYRQVRTWVRGQAATGFTILVSTLVKHGGGGWCCCLENNSRH